MTTAEIRDRVRRLVQDTESGNYHWTVTPTEAEPERQEDEQTK